MVTNEAFPSRVMKNAIRNLAILAFGPYSTAKYSHGLPVLQVDPSVTGSKTLTTMWSARSGGPLLVSKTYNSVCLSIFLKSKLFFFIETSLPLSFQIFYHILLDSRVRSTQPKGRWHETCMFITRRPEGLPSIFFLYTGTFTNVFIAPLYSLTMQKVNALKNRNKFHFYILN